MTSRTSPSRRHLLRGVVAGAAAVALAALAACSSTDDGETDVEGDSTIRIAYADEPPYAYTDDSGNVVGQSVAMHTYLLEQMGIGEDRIQWKKTKWDDLIPGLGTNHDMIIAGMFITPERCKAETAIFANPDYVMPDTLLVKAGNPEGLANIDSFVDSDAVLGVMNGTSEQEAALEAGVDEDRIVTGADLTALMQELDAGRVDGIALTYLNLKEQADADDGLDITEPFFPVVNGEEVIGAGAAVFKASDTQLRDQLNAELDEVLGDPAQWETLVGEYGFDQTYMPEAGLTAESLCGEDYK